MPLVGSGMKSSVSIDPQYDGVLMFSPDVVFFNDAQPRPDGRKIYHVFEQDIDSNQCNDSPDISNTNIDSEMKRKELFSKASENNLENVQKVLATNGILMQDSSFPNSCTSLVTVVPPHILLTNSSVFRQNLPDFHYSLLWEDLNGPVISGNVIQDCFNYYVADADEEEEVATEYHHFTIFKVYQFFMDYQPQMYCVSSQNRLLRKLKRKGIKEVEFEPENLRITVKTKRPAHIVLGLLKKIDPNVILLNISQDLVFHHTSHTDANQGISPARLL